MPGERDEPRAERTSEPVVPAGSKESPKKGGGPAVPERGVVRPRRRDAGKPKIEGYELEEVLGRGAMGTVYRARQLSVEREVALKILHPELVTRPRIVERMRREARMTARLAHPNLVSAVDMGTLDGRLWYAMEFVDGPSLSLRLRQEGRLSEREALRLFIPLCEALEHLSEHGIVHRDVKPANILLDRKGGARLADLGLAFADEDPEITKHGGTLGTPQYISPEQAVDPARADERSDLWSFGATLFHAVCGRPPFAGESTAEVLSAVLYERVPDPRELEPSLSKGFGLVLRKCLAREPDGRYQTPGELLLDLERVRERRQPRVRRSALDPVASQMDRRPFLFAAAALVLVAGGLLVGLYGPWGPSQDASLEERRAVEETSPRLDDLERRLAARIVVPGALLREYAGLEPDLPASIRDRGAALRTAILAAMQARADEVGRRVGIDVEQALAAGDFVGAWELLGNGVEHLLEERVGLQLAELGSESRIDLSWVEAVERTARTAETEALARLDAALDDQRGELERQVEDLLERQLWADALSALEFDRAALLATTGFGDHRFRADRLDEALVELRTWIQIQRYSVSDAWRAVDRELRSTLVKRADRLREELAAEGPAFSAAGELVRFFEQELSKRRLAREGMPRSLPTTALDALDHEVVALKGLEDGRLESDAREAFLAIETAAGEAWSRRDVTAVAELWIEYRDRRLRRKGGLGDAEWRAELERACGGRLLEATLVSELLQRVATAVVERSGSVIDLRLNGVKYSGRFLQAGTDPLRLGFRLEGLEENVRIQELSATELERLLERPLEDERGRIALAVLLFHDGDPRGALNLLRAAGTLQPEELEHLALDLAVRATDVLEREDAGRARADEARALLATVRDEERVRSDPRAVEADVERLLGEYGEEPVVAASREELQRLLGRLRREGVAPLLGPQALRPTTTETLRGGRERLIFDFTRLDPGAWTSDGWLFDGIGWTHEEAVATVAEFSDEEGLGLDLSGQPASNASVVARFDLEHPEGAGPPVLLVFEVDGVFVALVGERLPGVPDSPRVLAETGGLYALLERAQDEDDGRPLAREHALRPGQRRVVEVEVGPRRTRVDVRVDGTPVLSGFQLRPPSRPVRRVSLRAWEPVRLHEVQLELGR